MQVIPAGRGVGQGSIVIGTSGQKTTVSAVFVDLDDMVATLNNLTVGSLVEVECYGLFSHSIVGGQIFLGLSRDGAAELAQVSPMAARADTPFLMFSKYLFTASAASHQFKCRWAQSGGTATAIGAQRWLIVKELRTA